MFKHCQYCPINNPNNETDVNYLLCDIDWQRVGTPSTRSYHVVTPPVLQSCGIIYVYGLLSQIFHEFNFHWTNFWLQCIQCSSRQCIHVLCAYGFYNRPLPPLKVWLMSTQWTVDRHKNELSLVGQVERQQLGIWLGGWFCSEVEIWPYLQTSPRILKTTYRSIKCMICLHSSSLSLTTSRRLTCIHAKLFPIVKQRTCIYTIWSVILEICKLWQTCLGDPGQKALQTMIEPTLLWICA